METKLLFSCIRPNIIRCRYTGLSEEEESLLIAEEARKAEQPLEPEKDGGFLLYRAGELSACVSEEEKICRWESPEGLLLQEGKKEFVQIPVMRYTTGDEAPVIDRVETVDGERNFIRNLKEEEDHKAWQGRLHFCFAENEGIYGFGQAEEGIWNYRGHVQYLYQHNMRTPMPVMISSGGYGILFDCTSLMTFNDTENGSYLFFDCIRELDYYVIYGPSVDRIIEGIRFLTGGTAMLPKWAFGYVQSKEQYYTAKELTEVARRYRQEGVPIDCVVQDWNTWEKDKWGNKHLDPERYGDMKEQAEELKKLHVHSMVSVWPNMNSGTEDYEEFLANGQLLNDLATYNAFDEKAREVYWKQAKEGLFDQGFDSFWCDSTEPFSGPDWGGEIRREPWKRYQIVGDEHKKYLPPEKANAFALMHAKGIFENQRKCTLDKRVMNLTRSGYASMQRYGAMLWSGDTCASWDTLKKQITEGLNMSISGYPYWTLDIGGFFVVGKDWTRRGCGCSNDPTPKWFWVGEYDDGVKDPAYRELYVRWLQMGTFLPMFRSHGTDTPREIWNFGKPGEMFYDAIAKSIRLRYRLMPYLYSLAGDVRLRGGTIMRSLLFDFPDDPEAVSSSQEFLFGKSLLVCPVTKPMYYDRGGRSLDKNTRWNCYLPAGTGWTDFRTGERYPGGTWITTEAPIECIPVFVREGSVIPMQPGLSYAEEQPDLPMEIHVYSGADGECRFYDDAGDDYSCEQGAYEEVLLRWKDSDRKLILGERRGRFEGMRTRRKICIILDEEKVTEMTYSGVECTVTL